MKIEILRLKFLKIRYESLLSKKTKKFLERFLCKKAKLTDHSQSSSEKNMEINNSGTIYTCPMHPEVRQTGPGNCPKCGMALEPLIADETENVELVSMTKRFWLAAIFSIPLIIISLGDLLPGQPISKVFSPKWRVILEFLLASPICLWTAWPFYVRGIDSTARKTSICLP